MTFQHTFQNGQRITLSFDLSVCPPTATATTVPPGCTEEYRIWRNEVVLPAVHETLTGKQMEAMAVKGQEILRRARA